MYVCVYVGMYVYIHCINKYCPWKKWRNEKFLSSFLVFLLVAITFSLAWLELKANCELNFTPFGVFETFAPL